LRFQAPIISGHGIGRPAAIDDCTLRFTALLDG
jgi:hypothetical protein